MFTYVINTSENKTFESDKLFELSGYNKIRWMSCRLDEIGQFADSIVESQNVIGADKFRIAVIVDFYGFDRIRTPYGYNGYGEDDGIDASLYFPYIDAYITDNLIQKLIWSDIEASAVDVYYVQNGKFESFSFLGNEKDQLAKVLSGGEKDEEKCEVCNEEKCKSKKIYDKKDYTVTFCGTDGAPLRDESCKECKVRVAAGEKVKPVDVSNITPPDCVAVWKMLSGRPFDFNTPIGDDYVLVLGFENKKFCDKTGYTTFELHCTPTMSLIYKISDHPYGAHNKSLTYSEFVQGFAIRSSTRSRIKRHYYSTTYGGGAARAAFDTLSLSLYLIKMYEREENSSVEEIEVRHLDSEVLKNVLETAWSRVSIARETALTNTSKYYSLKAFMPKEEVYHDPENEDEGVKIALRALSADELGSGMSADELYSAILDKTGKTDGKHKDQAKFDEIMSGYLRKRDETRAKEIEESFEEKKLNEDFEMTEQCPSQDELNLVVSQKRKEISRKFDHALKAEYISIDFDKEEAKAEKAYYEYVKAKACMGRSIIGEAIFFILSMLVMLAPYQLLQLSDYAFFEAKSLTLKLIALGVFAGIMILSSLLIIAPLVKKMRSSKAKLQAIYARCNAKINYSFSRIVRRNEKELVEIEEANFQIEQICRLHEENTLKESHVKAHRDMLEVVYDRLSGMLNNLNIEPSLKRDDDAVNDFDISKSFLDKANGVYRIFSIDTIEKMFVNKEH